MCIRDSFSDQDKVAWINEDDGIYTDLISGHEMEAKGVMIPAFGCFWPVSYTHLPRMLTAAAESPPPIIVVASVSASAFATASVP